MLLFIFLFMLQFIFLFMSLFIFLMTSLFISLFIVLFSSLFMTLFIFLFTSLFMTLSIFLFTSLFVSLFSLPFMMMSHCSGKLCIPERARVKTANYLLTSAHIHAVITVYRRSYPNPPTSNTHIQTEVQKCQLDPLHRGR